jgi:hypothetical protein
MAQNATGDNLLQTAARFLQIKPNDNLLIFEGRFCQ